MWRRATIDEQTRFLRHLRPYWDVHRHRLAPEVAARIHRMAACSRLAFVAGKLCRLLPEPHGMRVTWRLRGSEATETNHVARIINCTGPQGSLLKTDQPLLRRLTEDGVIRPDTLNLGIDVDALSRVRARDGTSNRSIFAVGPMTRGAAREIVAVPDIRKQCWDLARRFANVHWVGGEGL